jgi:hypothetical protein
MVGRFLGRQDSLWLSPGRAGRGRARGVVIIRPLSKEESRVGEALHLALLLSAAVSGLLLGGSLLVVWAGRRRTQVGW